MMPNINQLYELNSDRGNIKTVRNLCYLGGQLALPALPLQSLYQLFRK